MSTITGGTSSTTTLIGLVVPSMTVGGTSHYAPADIAAINNAIKSAKAPSAGQRIEHGAFQNGVVFFPGRGNLKVQPGDYVFVDPNGWPILIPYNSIIGTGWTHT